MFDLNNYYFSLYAIPNLIVSTIIFVVGCFVFLQNRKNPSNIFFFLFCLSLNFWLYGRAIMYCSRQDFIALTWARYFAKFGVVQIAPLVYAFSVHWLGLYKKQKKTLVCGFVLAALFYLGIILTPYGISGVRHYFWGFYPVYGSLCKVFLLFFFTYFLAAFYNFFGAWKRKEDPARYKQIRIVTVAYLISFTGSVDFIPKVINFPFYPWGYLSVFVWTMVVAYAIVRYRMMDIQTVIHKSLMWFLSMSVAILPFAALIFIGHSWLLRLNPIPLSLFFIFLAILFSFYLKGVQPYLDKLFQRRSANLNLLLTRFSSELAHLKNLRDILQQVTRTIRRNLYTREISIFLRDETAQSLNPLIQKRIRGLRPIPSSHPFLKWLEDKDQVVLTNLIQSDPTVQTFQDAMREYIQENASVVVVPLVLGEKLIGVIHLGGKEGLRRYTSEEITFLTRLKSVVAVAFSNSLHAMQMQENLRKWNDELEQKVEERTRQLQDTQAQLVQAEKLATIGTLAGGVAHEINNPLTAVLANAQILRMTATADDKESLELIEEGAKRCQAIIQKLMNYSRKPNSGLEQSAKVNLNKVVDNTVAFLKYQLEQENIKLVVGKAENLAAVEGNSNELEQVLLNLILNAKDAVKAAGREGVIKISTENFDSRVALKVKDNGIGISEANIKKIFDPFFTTKDVGKGTGLGLAVSFGIVQRHSGSIQVNSQLNCGTEFIVLLPQKFV